MRRRDKLELTRRPVGVPCKCYSDIREEHPWILLSSGTGVLWGQSPAGKEYIHIWITDLEYGYSNVLYIGSYSMEASLELGLGTGAVSAVCGRKCG